MIGLQSSWWYLLAVIALAMSVGATQCYDSPWIKQLQTSYASLDEFASSVVVDPTTGDVYVAISAEFDGGKMGSACPSLSPPPSQPGINIYKTLCNGKKAWSTFWAHSSYHTTPTGIDISPSLNRVYIVSNFHSNPSSSGDSSRAQLSYVSMSSGQSVSCVGGNMTGVPIDLGGNSTFVFDVSTSPTKNEVYVVGSVQHVGGTFNAFIKKISYESTPNEWQDTIGSSSDDAWLSVFAQSDSDLIHVGGFSNGAVSEASGTNTNGDSVPILGVYDRLSSTSKWIHEYNTACRAVIVDVSAKATAMFVSGYSFCDLPGSTHPQTSSASTFIRRVNSTNGYHDWTTFIQGSDHKWSRGGSIALDLNDENFVFVSGFATDSAISFPTDVGSAPQGGNDIFVAKVSRETGQKSWVSQMGTNLDDEISLFAVNTNLVPSSVQKIGGIAASAKSIIVAGRTKGIFGTGSAHSNTEAFWGSFYECPVGRAGILTYNNAAGGCTPCPSGEFNNVVGIPSVSMCQDCQAGHFSGSGMSTCSSCGVGTYASTVGMSSCPACPLDSVDTTQREACSPCSSAKISNLDQSSCIDRPPQSQVVLYDIALESTNLIDTTSQFVVVGALAFAVVCCCGTSTVISMNVSSIMKRKSNRKKGEKRRDEEITLETADPNEEGGDENQNEKQSQQGQNQNQNQTEEGSQSGGTSQLQSQSQIHADPETVYRYLQQAGITGDNVSVAPPTVGPDGEAVIQVTTTNHQYVDQYGQPMTFGPSMGHSMADMVQLGQYPATIGPAQSAAMQHGMMQMADSTSTSQVDLQMGNDGLGAGSDAMSQSGHSNTGVIVAPPLPGVEAIPQGQQSGLDGRKAVVLFSYTKDTDEEMSLRAGETIEVTLEANDDWWLGRNQNGDIGYFPKNYIRMVHNEEIEAGSNRD